ncbi:MAG TPA: hypothetical protein DD635_00310, partial [Flavobacteriales bacterium]|nr:hypothetical protein [Flavobacteriales bacterium]
PANQVGPLEAMILIMPEGGRGTFSMPAPWHSPSKFGLRLRVPWFERPFGVSLPSIGLIEGMISDLLLIL